MSNEEKLQLKKLKSFDDPKDILIELLRNKKIELNFDIGIDDAFEGKIIDDRHIVLITPKDELFKNLYGEGVYTKIYQLKRVLSLFNDNDEIRIQTHREANNPFCITHKNKMVWIAPMVDVEEDDGE